MDHHINPSYKPKAKTVKTAEQYANGIAEGNRYELSSAITLAESTDHSKLLLSSEIANLLNNIESNTHSIRIAISGAPGVGKSTFIEQWGLYLILQGHKVAVLAIDPSSSVTHGSILGDKTRMHKLGQEPNAYIRPSAAGLTLGGVHHATKEAINLCEHAGYDIILIETVGVGQSETMASELSDIFLLLLLPGAGDEIQGIKRGIVELADIVIVNKIDGDRKALAKESASAYRNALSLFHHSILDWRVPVCLTSGLTNIGLPKVWNETQKFIELVKNKNLFLQKRVDQDIAWMHQAIHYQIGDLLRNNRDIINKLSDSENELRERKRSVHNVIYDIKKLIFNIYSSK